MAPSKKRSWKLRILPFESTGNEKDECRSTKYRKNLKQNNIEQYQINLLKDRERKKAVRELLKIDQSRDARALKKKNKEASRIRMQNYRARLKLKKMGQDEVPEDTLGPSTPVQQTVSVDQIRTPNKTKTTTDLKREKYIREYRAKSRSQNSRQKAAALRKSDRKRNLKNLQRRSQILLTLHRPENLLNLRK